MTLGEMQVAVARDIIQRDDVLNESLSNAFEYAHREVQRVHNWRAMESRKIGLTYPALDTTGVVVDASYKSSREVFNDNGGSLESILPTTESEANRLRRIIQNARGNAPSLTAGDIQRWYEAGLRVVLFIPPADEKTLVVDYFGYLSFYEDTDAEDFFSINMPEALQFGAAYYLSKNIYEDGRADHFLARFKDLIESAYADDVNSKQGGYRRATGRLQGDSPAPK